MMKGGVAVPIEESPPRAAGHKPFVEARRAQIDHHRDLKDREYTSVHEENRHLRDEVKDLDRCVKLLKAENKRLLQQLKEKVKDNEWLRTLLDDETAKVKAHQTDTHKMRQEVNEARAQLAEIKGTLQTKDDLIESLKVELVDAHKSHQSTQERCDALTADVQAAHRRVEEVRDAEAAKAKALDDQIAAVTAQLRSVESTLAESDARVDEAEAKVKKAEKVGEERTEALRKKIAAMKKIDEDAWSGTDDSDGAPKRRKAVRPNPAAVAAQKAQGELEAKLKQIEDERAAAALNADAAHAAMRKERDELVAAKAAVEAAHAAAIAALEEKLAAVNQKHTAEVAKRESVEADLRSELAGKADEHSSEKQLRQRVQDELSEAHDEINRLKEKVEVGKRVAIQLEQAREQRRVADDFTSRATHDLALRIDALTDELRAAQEDRDDAVELARTKTSQLVGALEQVDALHDEIDDLRSGAAVHGDDDARLREELQQLEMAVTAERLARQDADAAREFQSRSHQSLDEALLGAQRDLERLQMEVAARETDLADMRDRFNAEARAKAQLQDDFDALRLALQEEQQQHAASVAAGSAAAAAATGGGASSREVSPDPAAAGGEDAVDSRAAARAERRRLRSERAAANEAAEAMGADEQAVTAAEYAALVAQLEEARAALESAARERDEAIDSATAWKNHADRTSAAGASSAEAEARAAAAEERATRLSQQLEEATAAASSAAAASSSEIETRWTTKLSEEKESHAKQHATATARFEQDKADLMVRLKAAEAKTAQLDKSLDAKVALLKKEQEATRALKTAHAKELSDHAKRAKADLKALEDEIAALKAKLAAADKRASDAVARAAAASEAERDAKEQLAKLKEIQMHW